MASHTYNSSTRKAEAGRSFNSRLAFFTQQEQGQPESHSEKLYDLKFKKKKEETRICSIFKAVRNSLLSRGTDS